jgi:hypothetical protein
MTYNEIKAVSELAAIVVGLIVWFSIKWIEKRLGCKNDWELLALIWRKIKLLWRSEPKR